MSQKHDLLTYLLPKQGESGWLWQEVEVEYFVEGGRQGGRELGRKERVVGGGRRLTALK